MQTILWRNVNLFLRNCIFLIKLILSLRKFILSLSENLSKSHFILSFPKFILRYFVNRVPGQHSDVLMTCMSVLLIAGPKCIRWRRRMPPPGESQWIWRRTDKQTDGRTPDRYVTFSAKHTASVTNVIHKSQVTDNILVLPVYTEYWLYVLGCKAKHEVCTWSPS